MAEVVALDLLGTSCLCHPNRHSVPSRKSVSCLPALIPKSDNHLRTSPASWPLGIHWSASTPLQQSCLDLSTDHGEHEPQRHAWDGQESQMLLLNPCPDNKPQFILHSSSLSCFSNLTVQPAVSYIHQI